MIGEKVLRFAKRVQRRQVEETDSLILWLLDEELQELGYFAVEYRHCWLSRSEREMSFADEVVHLRHLNFKQL